MLVVEDDASIRELVREALTQEGLTVVVARDGGEAVRIAAERRPAAVVLDIELPVLDGHEVAAAIRERHGDSVPFVVMTASRTIGSTSAIRARAYVTKPFDLNEIVRAVRPLLEPPPASSEEAAPAPAS